MSGVTGFNDRAFAALMRLSGMEGRRIEQQEVAEGVAKRLGRPAYSQSTSSRWFKDAMPDLPTVAALAGFLEVDPGWLAFGEDSTAVPPTNHPVAVPVPRKVVRKRRAT